MDYENEKWQQAVDEYSDRFGEIVFAKYNSDEEGPYYMLLPDNVAGIGLPFESTADYIKFIDLCLKENKP